MAENIQKINETTTRVGGTVQKTTEVSSPGTTSVYSQNLAERVVWFVDGILMVLLGFRLLFSLLGANTTNGIANFVYSTSHPFVAPFFNLFSYNNIDYGASRFEIYTVVAMIFYSVIAWGIVGLLRLGRD